MSDIDFEPTKELVHLPSYLYTLSLVKRELLGLQTYVSKLQVLNPEFYEANHRLLMYVMKELITVELLLKQGKTKEDEKANG